MPEVWDTRVGDNLGVNYVDSGRAVRRLPGGGFLVAGSTGTAGAGSEDLWVLRLAEDGSRLADRTFGGDGFDGGNALVVTPGGDAFLGGFVQAPDLGSVDVFLARLSLSSLTPGIGTCLPTSPSGPNVWTSPLTVGVPPVRPMASLPATSTSNALATPLATGAFVCR